LLVYLGIFAIHIFGLTYTENWSYAFHDLKIKLPLLILPLVIGTSAWIKRKEFELVLVAFISAVGFSTLASLLAFLGFLDVPINDIRNISIFISHIRFSLMICLSFFFTLYFIKRYHYHFNDYLAYILGIIALWFLVFLGLLGARIGFVGLMASLVVLAGYYTYRSSRKFVAIPIFALILIFPIVGYFFVPNVQYRVNEVITEYEGIKQGESPNGNSIQQRLMYWEYASEIIKMDPILGVGTGDISDAFVSYYSENKTGLKHKYKLRAHNQYLSVLATFGILGLLIFLIAIFHPIYKAHDRMDIWFTIFLIIMMLSFITEDTLETQSGVTLFTLFYSILYKRVP
jgi:O-antigen ligase